MHKPTLINTLTLLACMVSSEGLHAQRTDGAQNPIIWADVPDPSVLRVGLAYYMSSTTMHMSPGVPIMKSTDLVNWNIVNYAYEVLEENDQLALRNGQNAYGKGSWASSLRFRNDTYYVVTFSYTTNRTHIYQTIDIEKGHWSAYSLNSLYHDPSLLFDDDGRAYLIFGIDDIRIIELNSDVTAVQSGGLNQVIIPNSSQIAGLEFYVSAEGSHIHKVDGKYYLFLISWPRDGMRTQLVYRADNVTGPYEGRIVLQDAGIAQGGLVDTPEGEWYAMLFQDRGSVGRVPHLIPVTWEDGWPVFGVDGRATRDLDLPVSTGVLPGIIASDEFDQYSATGGDDLDLAPVWQWNHNPDDDYWSVSERPGYLRLTNGRVDANVEVTQNTLTQRTFGPWCSAYIAVDVTNMKDGDYAGLVALQENYGFVGVKKTGTSKSIIMMDARSDPPLEVASEPISRDTVYLRIDIDYRDRADRALFYFSFDGDSFEPIGDSLPMSYTLSHFMGYRFGLFSYATKETGGFVDFDYFRVGYSFEEAQTITP